MSTFFSSMIKLWPSMLHKKSQYEYYGNIPLETYPLVLKAKLHQNRFVLDCEKTKQYRGYTSMAKIYWAYDQGAINTHQTLQLVSMETTHSALFRCSSLTCQSESCLPCTSPMVQRSTPDSIGSNLEGISLANNSALCLCQAWMCTWCKQPSVASDPRSEVTCMHQSWSVICLCSTLLCDQCIGPHDPTSSNRWYVVFIADLNIVKFYRHQGIRKQPRRP